MNDRGNIVIYQTKDGKTSIDVKLEDETVWLNQAQMAELFQKDRTVIGRHINNVYREGELERDITCAKFAHVISRSSSPSLKMLLMWRPMTVLSFWNSSALCACDSHTVSS